jgi:hypothetical protein
MMKQHKTQPSGKWIRPPVLFVTAAIASAWLLSQVAPAAHGKTLPLPEFVPADMKRQEQHPLDPVAAQPALSPDGPILFGVINDREQHYADEWQRGVRATVLELHWKFYEPQQGVYDQAYIRAKQARLAQLKVEGWYVQLVPGYQYVPDWVFARYPDTYYVNQYGQPYAPDPTSAAAFRVINAPFNPGARSLIAGYLARVFQDFDPADFDAVRIGGGVLGELRYPPPEWGGHTNSYWAFDAHAQNPAESGIPASVAGWRPGIDPNPGTLGRGQLIVNPGFEQSDPFFSVVGWSPDDQVTVALDAASAYSGGHALRVDIGTPHRVHQFVRVAPGTVYQFGAWLRSPQGGQARVFLTQYGADWQPVAGAPVLKVSATLSQWQRTSGSLTTGPSTRYLKVELDGDRPGSYYFDDLNLERQGETDHRSRDVDVPLAFYRWYVQKLADYQNWQIDQVRRYYDGQLDVVYAGKGLRANQVTGALTNDLRGDGWSENNSALYGASLYRWHVGGLSTTQPTALYLTGIEDPPDHLVDDGSPYPCDWSAARWIAFLADSRGLPAWAENSGRDTAEAMWLAGQRMHANGFSGLMWAFESELYAGPGSSTCATIDDYQHLIETHSGRFRTWLPVALKHP